MAEGSIKARIASLNLEQVHTVNPTDRPAFTYDQVATKKKPPPPPPGQRPSIPPRNQTTNNPPIRSNAPTSARSLGNQPAPVAEPKRSPALPPRPPPRPNSKAPPPSLPPRQPTDPIIRRRESNESIATVSSGISSLSLGSAYLSKSNSNGDQRFHVRAPLYDPNKLPPLPVKAKEEPKEESSIRKMMASKRDARSPIALPPSLPSRPQPPPRPQPKTQDNDRTTRRNLPPPPMKSALEWGLNKSTETPPPIPSSRPSPHAAAAESNGGGPPPIPLGSRPNLDAIMASKPKPGAQPQVSALSAAGTCLICRDFSAVDHHAAQFPRQTIPSSDAGWLAHQLCAPFSSLTDKARAIFTWLHHNVDYDTFSFFSGNLSPSTPERTIATGLAVCEGYAGLYAAIALKAGLECVVVSGHGKGYGHNALKPGEPIPAFSVGHAWNAVRIDNGEWKLLDACWGAGNVSGETYNRAFSPAEFTKSNEDFGTTHFPEDNRYFFRQDGRALSWEEYMMDDMGERLTIYNDANTEGLGRLTFKPSAKCIKVNDPTEPTIRFQFSVMCPHWSSERNGQGKPYIMILSIGGRDGRDPKKIPFNTDGKTWWLDIDRRELGCMGQKINILCVKEFDGRSGRGLTMSTYKQRVGRCGMVWAGISMWELV